jgi:hypothetical protein
LTFSEYNTQSSFKSGGLNFLFYLSVFYQSLYG